VVKQLTPAYWMSIVVVMVWWTFCFKESGFHPLPTRYKTCGSLAMTKFQLLVNNGVSAKLKQELAVKQPNTTSHLTSRGPSQQCFFFLEKNFAHDKEIAKIMIFFLFFNCKFD
jgi:hypothetical protein